MNIEKYFFYLPRTLEMICMISLAWLVASYLIPSRSFFSASLPIESNHSEKKQPPLILDTPLFGKIIQKKQVKEIRKVKPIIQAPVVISRLNIKLLGTVVAGERSAAIVIMNNNRTQKLFTLHANMQPDVTLDKVEAAAIVVKHLGKLERISLEKEKIIVGTSIISTNKALTPLNSSYQPQRVLHRNQLQQQMRDFSKLLSQARVTPHFKQGKSDGFTIMEIVSGSLYEQIGLQNGDVIQKVNGQAVTSAAQAMTMYQTLQNASSIDLELLRGSSVLSIHYDIQ